MKNIILVKARGKCNLTQVDVAKKVGITTRAYQHYEAGTREPSVKTAIMIARTVKRTVEELFS